MQAIFERVIASYQRCRFAGDFFDAFYDRFLKKAPDLPTMFERTDFHHQKRMLKQSLFELISFYRGIDSAAAEVAKLAERHRQMNVSEAHYQYWLEALVETAADFDPEFTDELASDWRNVMTPGIEAMQSSDKLPPTPTE
ncbi:MAG: globin [bacterium]|nr:globin [bacterium]